jgi:mitochondrial fission protein ELM1
MSALRILILSDGRPGHFNLSEGIAAAIERKWPATTERCEISRGAWSGITLAPATRARLPAAAMLRAVYGLKPDQFPACDVIVSAGAETLAANIWLARSTRVPNLFYGSLRAFDPHDFALVLTSYEERASRPRHAFTLKPSRLDPDTIPRPAPGPEVAGGPRTVGLLVGGDTSGIQFEPADWKALLSLVRDLNAVHGWRWQIANSRRTPRVMNELTEAFVAEHPTAIETFLDVRSAGAGTLPDILARCDAIVCTADSSSMISEAIWCLRPTLAVRPACFKLDRHERNYRDRLIAAGLCQEIAIAGATPGAALDGLADLTPLRHNPLDALGELLVRHLGPLMPPM